jgi:ketosteroid isomerase-like protein
MAGTKADLVRRMFDGFNRRDVDAVLSTYHPKAEMATLTSFLVGGTSYRGHRAIRGYLEGSLTEVWGDAELVAEELVEQGDFVVVRGRWRSRGRTSGVEVEMSAAWLFTVREGLIVASHAYRDVEDALAELSSPPPP